MESSLWAGQDAGATWKCKPGARAAACAGQRGDAEDQKGGEGYWGRRRCFLGVGGVLRPTGSPRGKDSRRLSHCCHLRQVRVGSPME